MGKEIFQFKQFSITQDHCAMKVGTDGVLLGAWAHLDKATTILDIGTGTGLLALLCAQRNKKATITGIEINADAALQAQENVAATPWANSIKIIHTSLADFKTRKNQFDFIICNPPYFTGSATDARSQARQQDALGLDAIVLSSSLLTEKGQIALIAPVDYCNKFELQIIKKGFFVNRKTWVLGRPAVAAKRILLQCSKFNKATVENNLIIEEFGRHNYSKEYQELTAAFYL